MRLGVTGRSRTGTSGFTAHGSSIELRPHPSARLSGLGGRFRTCDPMLPKHVRCHLRHTEVVWFSRVGTIHRPAPYRDAALPLSYTRSIELAPRRGFEPRTSWLTARRSAICAIGEKNWVPGLDGPIRTDAGLRRLVCSQMPSATWLRRGHGVSCTTRTCDLRLRRPAL